MKKLLLKVWKWQLPNYTSTKKINKIVSRKPHQLLKLSTLLLNAKQSKFLPSCTHSPSNSIMSFHGKKNFIYFISNDVCLPNWQKPKESEVWIYAKMQGIFEHTQHCSTNLQQKINNRQNRVNFEHFKDQICTWPYYCSKLFYLQL